MEIFHKNHKKHLPWITLASERPIIVNTLRILVTTTIIRKTFVYIPTTNSISCKPIQAPALIRSLKQFHFTNKIISQMRRTYRSIKTICVFIAIVGTQIALVIVSTLKATFRFYRIPLLTTTLERTQSVVTLTSSTNVLILLTFVNIYKKKFNTPENNLKNADQGMKFPKFQPKVLQYSDRCSCLSCWYIYLRCKF